MHDALDLLVQLWRDHIIIVPKCHASVAQAVQVKDNRLCCGGLGVACRLWRCRGHRLKAIEQRRKRPVSAGHTKGAQAGLHYLHCSVQGAVGLFCHVDAALQCDQLLRCVRCLRLVNALNERLQRGAFGQRCNVLLQLFGEKLGQHQVPAIHYFPVAASVRCVLQLDAFVFRLPGDQSNVLARWNAGHGVCIGLVVACLPAGVWQVVNGCNGGENYVGHGVLSAGWLICAFF